MDIQSWLSRCSFFISPGGNLARAALRGFPEGAAFVDNCNGGTGTGSTGTDGSCALGGGGGDRIGLDFSLIVLWGVGLPSASFGRVFCL